MAEKIVDVTEKTGRLILDTISRVQNMRGVGVYNGPAGIAISQTPTRKQPTPRPGTGSEVVVVQLTGSATGGGQYTGVILTGSSTADGTGNLTMPEGMTSSSGIDALILNLSENGESTHGLGSGYHLGLIIGTVSGGTYDGYTTVAIEAFGIACEG